MKKIYITVFAVLLATACVFFLYSGKTVKRTEYLLNTVINITVTGKNSEKAANAAIDEIKRIDKIMNAHDEKSELSKLNNADCGQNVKVSKELFSLIERSLEISKKTDGAFDVTLKPVSDLWGIGFENPQIPPDYKIKEALECTGYENISLNKKNLTVCFNKDKMSADLGAIAKGYAADRAQEILRKYKIKSALLDLGGNIYALGKRSDGKKWTVGLQTPWKARGEYFKKISVSDKAVVTSGAYERYFEKGGRIYHHILNPKTGYPADADIESVTVVCENSALADALSTAIFVGGKEAAETVVKKYDVTVYIYTENGKVTTY